MTDDLRIFISYRRSDTRGYVGWLSDKLQSKLPKARIFRDVESIGMGDWKKAIGEGLRLSDVVLVVVGERWLSITNESSDQRRLDDPEDMVRWEVASALAFKAERDCVAQVLLDDVPPPPRPSLPEDMQRLFDMQAYRLRYEDFDANVGNLVEHLRRIPVSRKRKLKGAEILSRWKDGRECPEWVGCGGGETVFLSMKKSDWLTREFEVEYMGGKKNNNWFHVRVLGSAGGAAADSV
jgi:hypothetical protein